MKNTDCELGSRLRKVRIALGISQKQLADKLGITFQQIQKYENGSNRIAVSRLHEIATALNVPVMLLFRDPVDMQNVPANVSEMLELFVTLPAAEQGELLFKMRAKRMALKNRSAEQAPAQHL